MKFKIALLSTLTFSFFTFSIPVNSYADSFPQSFLDDIRAEQTKLEQNIEIEEITGFSDYTGFNSFIVKHNPKLQKNVVKKIIENVTKYSNENAVDPKLVLALMARESSFRSNVVSKSGAIGLGQLKRATAKDMGVSNPFNIIENIKGTVKYLSWLLKRNDGDIDLTLASYNMGPGAVKRAKTAGITLPENVERYVNDIKNFHSTF